MVSVTENKDCPASIDAHRVVVFTGDLRMGRWAELKPAQFMLLAVIRGHQNRYTGECEIGAERLAEVSGIGRSTLFPHLSVLQSRGWLEVANPTRKAQANSYRPFDTIAIVVEKVRIGVVRAAFTPNFQEQQLAALRSHIRTAYQIAQQEKIAIHMPLMRALTDLSKQPEGAFIFSFALRDGALPLTNIARVTAFAQKKPRDVETLQAMTNSEMGHVTNALNKICPVKLEPAALTLPTIEDASSLMAMPDIEFA